MKQEISNLITNLPNKTSGGHDNISNIILKELHEPLLDILDYVINESLKQGVFPTIMKISEVVPLYKAGDCELVTNYRPISLLMMISKILEKIVYGRVYSFLHKSNQIYEGQFGFHSKHSCEHAIGQLVGHVIKNLEHKKNTISVFLELSKVFDTLEHTIVLSKMEKYGLHGVTLEWFKSYLSG